MRTVACKFPLPNDISSVVTDLCKQNFLCQVSDHVFIFIVVNIKNVIFTDECDLILYDTDAFEVLSKRALIAS